MGVPVRWVWVKGHRQVDGNEAADKGATKGKTGNQTAVQPQVVMQRSLRDRFTLKVSEFVRSVNSTADGQSCMLLLRRRCPTAVGSQRPFSPEGRKHAPARSTHAARQKAAAWLHHPKLSAGHKSP